jgi:Flp pilus assembly protein TadG
LSRLPTSRAGRGSPSAASTSDAGYVTAETALALPSLMAVFFALLLIVLAVADQLRCADAAWEAARLIARGESAAVADQQASRWAPAGARITVLPGPGVIRVEVSVQIGLSGSRLPSLHVSGDAQIACEPGSECSGGDP